jgi:hypothetical protein
VIPYVRAADVGRIAEILLHSNYKGTDLEKLARESARGKCLVITW